MPVSPNTLQQADSWIRAATASLYLLAATATTLITYFLGYEDWFLYALMSLCTATVVTNYSILQPNTPRWIRWMVVLFAELVITAWSLLLFEKTQVGWLLIEGQVINHSEQAWFYVPVVLNGLCGLLLALHLVVVAPHLRKSTLLST